MNKILLVDDDRELTSLLKELLEMEGFNVVVAYDGEQALEKIDNTIDLLLLDVMMPKKNGIETLKELRQRHQTPVIMLTARGSELDRVRGLELGADDYVCKPFSPRELVARVKAVLRRFRPQATAAAGPPQPSGAMAAAAGAEASDQGTGGIPTPGVTPGTALGNPPGATPGTGPGALSGAAPGATGLTLDESTLRVHWQGRTVELTAVEFSLLATLHASPGRIYSRNRLMALIYRDHRVVSDRTIDSHIKKLRRKLEELSPDQEWVHSVYGVGYRYEEQD